MVVLLVAALFIGSATAFAQGTVNFATFVPGQVDAPVTDNGMRVQGDFLGQLYYDPSGAGYMALGNPVPFRSASAAGYIIDGTISVPAPGTVRMKLVAWAAVLGTTYEQAQAQGLGGWGESAAIAITPSQGPTPANLVGLAGFQVSPLVNPIDDRFALPLGFGNSDRPAFVWRIHQAIFDPSGPLPNTNTRTEDQLAGRYGPNVANPSQIGAANGPGSPPEPGSLPIEFQTSGTINLALQEGNLGNFPNDLNFPGIPGLEGSTDNIAAEVLTWIEFSAGIHRLVVNSDDGFRFQLGGATPADRFAPVVGEFNGGRAPANTTNTLRIPTDGLYAARFTWQQGGGGANLEISTLNADAYPVLLNDPFNSGPRVFSAVVSTLPAYAARVVPMTGDPAADFDTPVIVELEDGTQAGAIVSTSSVQLTFDGVAVNPNVSKSGSRTFISYQPPIPIPAGVHRARLTFSAGVSRTEEWTFTIAPYGNFTSAMKVLPDVTRPGFLWTVFQNEEVTENTSVRAEYALAGLLQGPNGLVLNRANLALRGAAIADGVPTRPAFDSTPLQFEIPGVLNLNQSTAEANGNFTPDQQMPGIPGSTASTDGITAEIVTYVTLPAGVVTLGVNSDDGFVAEGTTVDDPPTRFLLGSFEDPIGRTAADTLFRFWVQEAGTYPLRILWYEGVGGASVEVFSVNASGAKILLNDSTRGGFPAYRALATGPAAARPVRQYYEDFDSTTVSGASVRSTAVLASTGGIGGSGVLKLTTATAGQQGSFVVQDFLGGRRVTNFWARFHVLIGGGDGADGLSFAVARDLPAAPNTFGEEGAGSGLVTSVDTYPNPGESTSVSVRLAGQEIAIHDDLALRTGENFVEVQVHLAIAPAPLFDPARPFYFITAKYNNVSIRGYSQQTALAGWELFQSDVQWGFGGRTGALVDNHWIDNVLILANYTPGPPVFVAPPVNTVVRSGERARLSVVADGTPPLDYQWLINGTPIAGATEPIYTTPPVSNGSGSPLYSVRVSNALLESQTSDPVTVRAGQTPPTISSFSPQTIFEDKSTIPIPFIIGDAGTPAADLTLTGASSDSALIPSTSSGFRFGGAGPNRTLIIQPTADRSGQATITVTVKDSDGETANATFTLTVLPENDPPTLNPIDPVTVNEDSGSRVVNLTGISSGALENDLITVTASSDNSAVVPGPTVSYQVFGTSGSLTFTPVPNASGSANISVTVRDAGLNETPGDSDDLSVQRSFFVVVNAVNDPPTLNAIDDVTVIAGSGVQNVPLAGITAGGGEIQALRVEVFSDNPTLISNPGVSYSSPNTTGTLRFTAGTLPGVARITVTVVDAGLNGRLGDSDDLSSARSFSVTVAPSSNRPPELAPIPDQIIPSGLGTVVVQLEVSDPDTPLSKLVPSWSTSNTNLVRGVVFGGGSATQPFFATISARPNRSGIANVTFMISDGTTQVSETFRLFLPSATGGAQIVVPPIGFVALPNEDRRLVVFAEGTPPLTYVWRCNGIVLPSETRAVLEFNNIQPEEGAAYSVFVYNREGIVQSSPALVQVTTRPVGELSDNWPPPATVSATEGYLQGSNATATRQTGEPNHAGKPGGRSMWFTWIPPSSGIATLRTLGSSFDTLLAVYTGDPLAPGARPPVAFNEDGEELSLHCFSSQVRFNARVGEAYQVAIDGFYGTTGQITLHLDLEPTGQIVPVIARQPANQAVVPGTREVQFAVELDPSSAPNASFRWFHNGLELSDRRNPLPVGPVDAGSLGEYYVVISNGSRSTRSDTAVLELTTYAPPRTTFESGDVWDFPSLAAKLKIPDTQVTTYLRSRFLETTRRRLDEWLLFSNVPQSLQVPLINELAVIIRGPSIYDAARFTGIYLRPETLGSLNRNLVGDDLARLNRLLLEDAFPSEILRRTDAGVTTEDKLENARIAGRLQTQLLRLAGRTLAAVAPTAVFPGVPYSRLFAISTHDHTQPKEGPNCGLVLDKTRWLELNINQPGTVVIDTLGSEIDTVAALYRVDFDVNGEVEDLATLGCNHDAGGTEPWSLLIARNLTPGTYYAQVEGWQQSGLIQFNWMLLTNDASGSLMPHLGVQRFLTNYLYKPGSVSSLVAQTNYAIRLTFDADTDPTHPWELEAIEDWSGPLGAPRTTPVVTPAFGWLRLQPPPPPDTPGSRFFRAVRRPRRKGNRRKPGIRLKTRN